MIIAIPASDLDSVWDQVKGLLERALAFNSGDIDIELTKERIESGEYLLLIALRDDEIQACFVAELVTKALRKSCNIVLCGGHSINGWLGGFMDTIREIALEQGCDNLSIIGRHGWVRKMKVYGFEEKARVLEVML